MSTTTLAAHASDKSFLPVSATRPDGTMCQWKADEMDSPDGMYVFQAALDLRTRLPGVGLTVEQDHQGGPDLDGLPAHLAHIIVARLCNIVDTAEARAFLDKESAFTTTLHPTAVQLVLETLADLDEKAKNRTSRV